MDKAKKLFNYLKRRKKTIAIAESITGGYVSFLLTSFSGASSIFKFGAVVYSLEAKRKLFGLDAKQLKYTQGVSEDIARSLAKKIRDYMSADYGASIVGFAGPKAKKGMKGVVFMGFSSGNKTITKEMKLKGNRDEIRKKASKLLIEFILENIAQR